MFGRTVLGIDGEHFESQLDSVKKAKGTRNDVDLGADDLRELVEQFKAITKEHAGPGLSAGPARAAHMAIRAVFDSWMTPRAVLYRRQEQLPDDLGTAVNVCTDGLRQPRHGLRHRRRVHPRPGVGAQGVYGDYLQNAQGEDVVAGIRNTVPLADLEGLDKVSYDQLLANMSRLESHYRDLCDIEFTVERGTLWMLQTRVGKRTAAAAFTVATQLLDEGLIDIDEALRRVTGAQLAQLMFPTFDPGAERSLVTQAIGASPGAASGTVVFDSATAEARAAKGEKVILVRRETNPDDLPGMIAAIGVLTSRGGKTSHAAVVARGMGKTCVCGAEELEVDAAARKVRGPGDVVLEEGDMVSIDGTTGEVFAGEVAVQPSPVVRYFEGGLAEAEQLSEEQDSSRELVHAVHRLMEHADATRRLAVRTNADTADDSSRARRFGAEGTGLCRTEHMFLGERREQVERLVLADSADEQQPALDALEPLQRATSRRSWPRWTVCR
jgi:pyruvate,orthophosphate dikinase